MWIESVAFFLGVALLLYCLFAGADFGAGILEISLLPSPRHLREEQEELVTHAMGPVWEANHVWLVLVVVILFNGFPRAYSELSTRFHIPLTFMLVGIILRGCAFTFRHYDAVRDRSRDYYSALFMASSVLTPWMLGVVAGAMFLRRPVEDLTAIPDAPGFAAQYVWPWLNWFSFSVGAFTCGIFAFLASVYLIGETADRRLKDILARRARVANISVVLLGGLVFGAAELDGLPLASLFASEPWSCLSMALATVLLVPIWMSLRRKNPMVSRMLAASQMALVLLGWFKLQFPVLLAGGGGEAITLYSAAAPVQVLRYLLYALLAGSALIFPALFYLLRIFKRSGTKEPI